MGRKSTRTAAIDKKIITGLSKGTPLTIICREEGMPHDNTVREWAKEDKEFAGDIARAREAGFDQIALEALSIADHTADDTIKSEDGAEKPNSEWITRSRLRVETRLKLLAKWDPKRYGDTTKLNIGDADGEKLELDEVGRATRLAAIFAGIEERAKNADEA